MKLPSKFQINDEVWFSTKTANKEGVILSIEFTESKVFYNIGSMRKVYKVDSCNVRKAK